MNLIEQLRKAAVEHTLLSFSKGDWWKLRREFFQSAFAKKENPSPRELLLLGDHLSAAFQLDGKNNRNQDGLANAGHLWSGLVLWYLNLCYAGTHAVAVRAPFIPGPIGDALRVTYNNVSLRSDMDILVLACRSLKELPEAATNEAMKTQVASHLAHDFSRVGVVNVQTKTNWKDNAQIPMLWNLLFRLARTSHSSDESFVIGAGDYHMSNLGYFAYSFATVPTNSPQDLGPSSMPVLRVSVMTGGAFWGRPTKNGVCYP